ncbi:hypothetical protein GA0061078_1411 [Bifidobacterium bohemicum]|uniref:Leucine rich repeat variant domain-containing protein n=1 Tax=Bifidobacterium bohemicum DSM 22767 TaxID=1437606 RepID=A0A086ZGV2_9BIFI|nr:hypothetical protein [Bifidobacterium bohemicum]KFI45752.1 hypothetical protein BBOH_0554 [Bifidobacterium bohemicum DSM 22767]SCC08616.1 hypothetical protein GA0061078_1411 [Bifidobacterium bohemicum]
MVDYDTAVATVQDQNADPVLLAKIAYENPDFGANVAANPRAYPGLKRWLAEFGDDRAKQTLSAMGFNASASAEQQAQAVYNEPSNDLNQMADPQPATPTNAQPQQSVATNPYGFTAEQALDPNTDQLTIARIAQYAPELRPCLARNPNTYPELLDWLAKLGDPAINAALASRGQ